MALVAKKSQEKQLKISGEDSEEIDPMEGLLGEPKKVCTSILFFTLLILTC